MFYYAPIRYVCYFAQSDIIALSTAITAGLVMREVASDVVSSPNFLAVGDEYGNHFERKLLNRLNETIESLGSENNYARDLEIFGEGERPAFVYKVITGAVRAYKVLNDGRRQILGFYFPGDIFGFDASHRYAFSADAVASSSLFIVKRNLLIAAAAHQLDVANELWLLVSRDLEHARNHSMTLGCKSAQERVMDFLFEVARKTRSKRIAHLSMSRSDVADYLGLTIETVSRALAHLESNSDIKLLSSRHIILQKAL